MSKALKVLTAAAVAGMFLVLMMGSLVTNSGSADGCGDSWPLCDGKFLPVWDVHAIIEFSHRAVSGLTGLLVLAAAVWAWRSFGRWREVRLLAPASVILLVVQAALGALAVVWRQPKTVLALHFGISLMAFAAVLLMGLFMFQVSRGDHRREQAVSSRLRTWVWASTAYIYGVVYLGAYVRHTHSELACTDWPLCNGTLVPPLSGAVGIQFAHRVAAALGLVLLVWVTYQVRQVRAVRPDIYHASMLSVGLIVLQVISGGVVVLSGVTLGAMMVHSALIVALFGVLGYLCMQVTPRLQPVEKPKQVAGSTSTT